MSMTTDDEDDLAVERWLQSSSPDLNDSALPNETLHAIFALSCPTTLPGLALASRRFRAIAERILYESITIADHMRRHDGNEYSVPWRTIRCCRSLMTRLHLSDCVRRLSIRWVYHNSPQSHSRTPSTSSSGDGLAEEEVGILETLEHINVVLHLFGSLDFLELNLSPANFILPSQFAFPPLPNAIEVILSRPHPITLPNLTHLSLSTDTPQRYTRILADFLRSSPKVRTLRLGDCMNWIDVNPSENSIHPVTWSLPHLHTFRGFPLAAASLLPYRPVVQLSLQSADDRITAEILMQFAQTSSAPGPFSSHSSTDVDPSSVLSPTLSILDLSAVSVRPALLMAASKHLGSQLEVLKIKLALRHTLHYAMSGIRILSGLSAVLSAFPKLYFLDLSPTAVSNAGNGFSPTDNTEEERSLCNEWGRGCPSLRLVTFPSRNEWTVNKETGTWVWVQNRSS